MAALHTPYSYRDQHENQERRTKPFHLHEGKLVTKCVRVILSVCNMRRGACNVYLSVKSDRHARAGLAGLPVPFAEYTAVGLYNFQIEVEHSAILILW